MTFDNRKYPQGEWSKRIQDNAATRFISVEEELPDAWHAEGWPQNMTPLEQYRFKVKLAGGLEYWSYYISNEYFKGWSIEKNSNFIVTHWVKPIWVA